MEHVYVKSLNLKGGTVQRSSLKGGVLSEVCRTQPFLGLWHMMILPIILFFPKDPKPHDCNLPTRSDRRSDLPISPQHDTMVVARLSCLINMKEKEMKDKMNKNTLTRHYYYVISS